MIEPCADLGDMVTGRRDCLAKIWPVDRTGMSAPMDYRASAAGC
jgi:hypothetical protein